MFLVGLWAYDKSMEATVIAHNQVDSVSCKPSRATPAKPQHAQKKASEDDVQALGEEAGDGSEAPADETQKKFNVTITSSEMEIKDVAPEPNEDGSAGGATIEEDKDCLAQMAVAKKEIQRRQKKITLWLILSGLVLLLLLFLIGLKGTHRFVGPLFRVKRDLLKMKANDFAVPYDLREKDRLQVFFGKFKSAHAVLKKMHEDDVSQLEAVKKLIDATEASKLTEEQMQFKARLEKLLTELRPSV